MGRRVEAGAEVSVNEVHAGVFVADEDLALLERGDGDILVFEDFCAAVLGDLHGFHVAGDGSHCVYGG